MNNKVKKFFLELKRQIRIEVYVKPKKWIYNNLYNNPKNWIYSNLYLAPKNWAYKNLYQNPKKWLINEVYLAGKVVLYYKVFMPLKRLTFNVLYLTPQHDPTDPTDIRRRYFVPAKQAVEHWNADAICWEQLNYPKKAQECRILAEWNGFRVTEPNLLVERPSGGFIRSTFHPSPHPDTVAIKRKFEAISWDREHYCKIHTELGPIKVLLGGMKELNISTLTGLLDWIDEAKKKAKEEEEEFVNEEEADNQVQKLS